MEYQIRVENQNKICADEEKNKAYVWKLNGLLDYSVWSWDQSLLSYYLMNKTWAYLMKVIPETTRAHILDIYVLSK